MGCIDEEFERRRVWQSQLLIFAAHGPTDASRRRRYYAMAVLVVVSAFVGLLIVTSAAPKKAPPPTTYPVLTFPTTTP